MIDTLRRYEPAALHTQIPVVWHRAHGSRVWDEQGRSWLDWTSGILTANAGHAPPSVVEAICAQANAQLLHAYGFPTAVRARVVRALCDLTGFPQVVLATTGAEAVEACLKIARSRAQAAGRARAVIVSFDGAFHGRTLGAQMAGGLASQRQWTRPLGDDVFVRVPFPARGSAWKTAHLEEALACVGAAPADVALVLTEIYQGSTLEIIDGRALRLLRDWCDANGALLALDEIQSGFGRTGTLFAHMQFGVRPDLLLCGKGISGSLPVSAVLIADARHTAHLAPGDLSTTHAANPVSLAAVEANLKLFSDQGIVAQAARGAEVFCTALAAWLARSSRRRVYGVFGLVAGIGMSGPSGADSREAATALVEACAEHGLLLCAPAGRGGTMVKLMPPLTTSIVDLEEGFARLDDAAEALG
ncbi:aminotransferase class III-fold pyridoxal phosphate-dependent enzyme [Actinocorallia aurea]